MKFKGGAMGLIAAQHPYMIFEMELLGSEGRIKESGNGQSWTMWSSKKSETYHGFNELVEELFPRPQEAAKTPLAMAVANVVNALEGREFTSTGRSARAALELVMAIRESGELGEIVRLPLKNRKRRTPHAVASFTAIV